MLLLPFIFSLGITVYGIEKPGEKLTRDPNCECEWRYLDHYEALGCRPVYEENPDDGKPECKCPKRFDCSKTDDLNADGEACVYKKQVYPVGTEIPTTDPCITCSCRRDYITQNVNIDCINIECFSDFRGLPRPKGCYYVYTEDTCCPSRVECPVKGEENSSKVPICEYNGKMYYEGQHIYSDERFCVTCLCTSNWTGINSASCKQADCMLETKSKLLNQGCIPIYHEDACCPIDYHCPKEDFNVSTESTFKSKGDEDEMCFFEGRYYPIGHALDFTDPNKCASCICKTPPVFTCLYRPYWICHGEEAEDSRIANQVYDINVNRELSFKSEDNETCLYRKQRYPVGTEIPTKNPCEQCFCRKEYYAPAADIECTYVDCPSIYPIPKGCHKVYTENKCCPTNVECSNETQNSGIQLTKDRHCDCDWKYLQHYEAKDCHPVYDEKPGDEKQECTCPLRFDCSEADVMYANETACVYKKQYYPVGTDIPITNRCRRCSCRKNDFEETARIACTVNDCPTIRLPEGCHHVYTEKECCPTSVECPGEEEGNSLKAPICEYKGKMYYEGQHIHPDEGPCLTCICNSNWIGINSTSCSPRDCLFELNSEELKQGCIPIYYENMCCPIEYHCPNHDVELKVNRESSLNSKDDTDEMCYFEGQYYPIGHVLDYNHTTNCVTCTCKIPPDFTCIQSSCSLPPDADYTDCRTVRMQNACCPKHICREKNGIIYSPYECIEDERKKCDDDLLPEDYPETAEELRSICDNFADYSRCLIHVHESCEYSEESLDEKISGIKFINSICEEDDPIYKIISSNLECITPLARKLKDTCNSFERISLIRKIYEDEISTNFTRQEIRDCLWPFWHVNCPSITLGFHCGSEVRIAANAILIKTNDRYRKCSSEILEELQPILEKYEIILESERKFKDAFSKRK